MSEVSIAPNATGTFYMAIKPFTAKSGETLTVTIETDGAGATHEILLTKDVTFSAGKIKTVNATLNVVDYVTLPWFIDGTGGKAGWSATGLSSNGLGSNYANSHSPYLTKLDDTGDYVQVKYDSPAKTVEFGVKKIGGAGNSTIDVQGSIDGVNFQSIQSFTISGNQGASNRYTTTEAINTDYRFIRLYFTQSSNVGLGKVSILPVSTNSIINIDNISDISARSASLTHTYEIHNPVSGTQMSVSCDGTVVTSASVDESTSTITYSTSDNTSSAAREGSISLTYGSVSKQITVSQNAPEFKLSRTEVELKAEANSSTSITVTSDFDWTAAMTSTSGGFSFSPESFTWTETANGKQTVTITATAANASEAGAANLGKIVFTNTTTGATLELVVKQASSYVAPVTGNVVSKTIKELLNNVVPSNETQYDSFVMNDVITLTANGGSNTGKVYGEGTEWRFYANEQATLTISSTNPYKISSVKITFSTKDNGCLKYNNQTVSSGSVISTDSNTVTLSIGSSSGNKGKVFITAIEVTYTQETGGGESGGETGGTGNENGGGETGGGESGGSQSGSQNPAVDQPWLEMTSAKEGSQYVVCTPMVNGERNYTVFYDKSMYTPLWTAYPLNSSHMGNLSRPNDWDYNPLIGEQYQINVIGSSYSGYSRGHLCPNGSRNGIRDMQLQTFYMTNQVPQIQTRFNDGIWNSLENAVQAVGNKEEIYVVTGVAFNKEGETKTIKYVKDDSNKDIPVPNYFYKVVLRVKKPGSTVTSAKTVGFWFENKEYSNSTYSNYSFSVDQIEEWTGFDFFVNLPDDIENAAESQNTTWSEFQNF